MIACKSVIPGAAASPWLTSQTPFLWPVASLGSLIYMAVIVKHVATIALLMNNAALYWSGKELSPLKGGA